MKRIAIIKNGIVENVALWEDDDSWKDATEDEWNMLIDVTDKLEVGPDFTYSGGTFTQPFYVPKEADDDTGMSAKEIEAVVAQVLEQMEAK